MESILWPAATLAATLAYATWRARRLGNDRRDVILLGAFTVLLTVGLVYAMAI